MVWRERLLRGEDEVVHRIVRRLAVRPGRSGRTLALGIGDDAAILRPGAAEDWVISSDFSLEGVHFRPALHPPEAVGYRALARAASDLAAMGAHPLCYLLALSLPDSRLGRWLDRVLGGLARASRELRLPLIGGDTTRWPEVAIAITVVGRVKRGRAARRDRARPGDRLFVSGRLGAAALGLAMLDRPGRRRSGGTARPAPARLHRLLRPHLYPSIPLDLGIHLAERGLASAMMDLSDGLSTDLARLARASHVGARVFMNRLPAVAVPDSLAQRGLDRLRLALDGGEDYGLLFTARPARAREVPRSFRATPVTCIGEIVRGGRVEVVDGDGRSRSLTARGWDPFREGG